MLPPSTVTDADPVPAWLPLRISLNPATSTDHPRETLPSLTPAVITTRRVPPDPCATLHLTDVSDSQSVPSHPVCPSRPRAVYPASPIPDPCTVIDPDPVPARFCRRVKLTPAPSTDHPSVKLRARSLAVITTRRVPPPPSPTNPHKQKNHTHTRPPHPPSPTPPPDP